jgi:hypothetical protein
MKPLVDDMVPKLSAQPIEWNSMMASFDSSDSPKQRKLEYQVQIVYQLTDSAKTSRHRGLKLYKHVQKLNVDPSLSSVDNNFISLIESPATASSLATDFAPHVEKIVLDLRDDDDDNCGNGDDSDCDFIVTSEAMPVWLLVVILLTLIGLFIIILWVSYDNSSDVWAPRGSRPIYVVRSPTSTGNI